MCVHICGLVCSCVLLCGLACSWVPIAFVLLKSCSPRRSWAAKSLVRHTTAHTEQRCTSAAAAAAAVAGHSRSTQHTGVDPGVHEVLSGGSTMFQGSQLKVPNKTQPVLLFFNQMPLSLMLFYFLLYSTALIYLFLAQVLRVIRLLRLAKL